MHCSGRPKAVANVVVRAGDAGEFLNMLHFLCAVCDMFCPIFIMMMIRTMAFYLFFPNGSVV